MKLFTSIVKRIYTPVWQFFFLWHHSVGRGAWGRWTKTKNLNKENPWCRFVERVALAVSTNSSHLLPLGVSKHLQKRPLTGTFPTTREGVGLKLACTSQDPPLTPSLSFSRMYIQIHKSKRDVMVGISLKTVWIYYLLSSILDNNSYYDYLQTTSPKAMELVGGHTTAEDCGNSRRGTLQSPLEPEEIRLSPTGEVINREIRPGNKQPILLRLCLPITVVMNIQVKCLEIIKKQTHNPKIPIISILRNTYHDHFPYPLF